MSGKVKSINDFAGIKSKLTPKESLDRNSIIKTLK
jgi:hypothetical protein